MERHVGSWHQRLRSFRLFFACHPRRDLCPEAWGPLASSGFWGLTYPHWSTRCPWWAAGGAPTVHLAGMTGGVCGPLLGVVADGCGLSGGQPACCILPASRHALMRSCSGADGCGGAAAGQPAGWRLPVCALHLSGAATRLDALSSSAGFCGGLLAGGRFPVCARGAGGKGGAACACAVLVGSAAVGVICGGLWAAI